ncbi:hypothetical protein P3342_007387 [Pyrenophora teres f. teres]|nr:hypothetical protein P3342_007387 [Pyrenophora teres f. teres]
MELFERLQVQPKMFITNYDTALKTALTSIYPNHAVKVWDTRYGLTAEEKVEIDRKRVNGRSWRLITAPIQPLLSTFWTNRSSTTTNGPSTNAVTFRILVYG